MNIHRVRGAILALMSLGLSGLALPARTGADRGSTAEQIPADQAPQAHGERQPRLELAAFPTCQDIARTRIFEEPLVPIGGEPGAEENATLAAALKGYAQRSAPDDFSHLTQFLDAHPQSPWRASLLTCLGLEYYRTAYYSRALAAWEQAWPLAKDATDRKAKAVADRAAGELVGLYSRLGRTSTLDAFLQSVEGRHFVGAATEKIGSAQESLWTMQHRPAVAFKCGPYALQSILRSGHGAPGRNLDRVRAALADSASTSQGLALSQVAGLSREIGLNYQMAFRIGRSEAASPSATAAGLGEFVVPAVVHWKVGHYAALVRREGDRFLLEDPTFGNSVWATRQALEAETSGYFLIPPGGLPPGWRGVDAEEGGAVWGKGQPPRNDPNPLTPQDPKKPCDRGNGKGVAVPSAHLMLVSLNIVDTPVGYAPPVGPPVQFTVTYNQRDAAQPANFTYSNFGPKWTCDWIAYITDNPQSTLANANLYVPGGGTREYAGFETNAQAFAPQQYDQTRLRRTGPDRYELESANGSLQVFSQPDGTVGTTRKIFLTQVRDAFGNTVSLSYDAELRLVALTDAIGQVTTVAYGDTNDIHKITRVTDPFGRFAEFAYDAQGRLTNITDAIGLTSGFTYSGSGDRIDSLITPYGTHTFIATQGGGPNGTTRSLETLYPDGSLDRVEYNQSENLGIATNDPPHRVPAGMATHNAFLHGRNTYYWSRTACASGYGDYSQAKIYHWLHAENLEVASGILESTKEPLENRVWYNYPGQTGLLGPGAVGTSSRPTKVGRVLEDGTTQLYTYAYDSFGHVTQSIDPIGRTFSYLYAANGIDLLEVRQTRAGNNELLFRATYDAQHRRLTQTDAAGQTTTFTYNARGQQLTETNPNGESTTFAYDANGYLAAVDGPLPGTNDVVTATYDAVGRTRTKTDQTGYTLSFEYDPLDRLTRITHPDGSAEQIVYERLDIVALVDRAGRRTEFEFDGVRQMKKKTDPLGRVTLFDWCRCGDLKSLTDPLGRTTTWLTDAQGRLTAKQYGDGSQVRYLYESASSRLQQVIDEQGQATQFAWNADDTMRSITHVNAQIPTPGVSYTYDPNYPRLLSMTDGTGTTVLSYHPVASTPTLGATLLASVDGPLPDDTITYGYDPLGRRVSMAITGVGSTRTYDAAGRLVTESNVLGSFSYAFDGAASRLVSVDSPNGLRSERAYGGNTEDHALQRITHRVGAIPVSEFRYDRDPLADRITSWSQQAGAAAPDVSTFTYDAADQLLAASVTRAGVSVGDFAYAYDFAANRLAERVGSSNVVASYNALNQISTTSASDGARTLEWDAKDRLVALNSGVERTEFAYDGQSHLSSLRHLTNGGVASFRRFVWADSQLCEERDAAGAVTKRFFPQGMMVATGPQAGAYFYTQDHLGSIRELVDRGGNVRARYAYDPFGRRTRIAGDLDADRGFAGMLFVAEANVCAARFRAYDPGLGRWLSRDLLRKAEMKEGPNLYAYVHNNPVNWKDPLGLCCEKEKKDLDYMREWCVRSRLAALQICLKAMQTVPEVSGEICEEQNAQAADACDDAAAGIARFAKLYWDCLQSNSCEPLTPCSGSPVPPQGPRNPVGFPNDFLLPCPIVDTVAPIVGSWIMLVPCR